MQVVTADILKILLALLLGGLIGIERDVRDKAAGFRTLMFICVGSTLFTILSLKLASQGSGDITRIAANIVSGVGFLGAGVILRERGQVRGLTTAATVWLVAALGMAVGAGEQLFAVIVTAIVLVVLWFFPALESLMENVQQARQYQVICRYDIEKYRALIQQLQKSRLIIGHHHFAKEGDLMKISWSTNGRTGLHHKLVDQLVNDPDILDFSF